MFDGLFSIDNTMSLSHQALSESCVVPVLMEVARDVVARAEAAMAEGGTVGAEEGKEESTLKVVLSALWNLSAHCGKNKVKIKGSRALISVSIEYLNY